MNIALADLELLRARWRRARAALGIGEVKDEEFGRGGLARHLEAPGVRFLMLPTDPDGDVVAFDEEFWKWWLEERANPFEGAAPTDWGKQSTPSAGAAVRFHQRAGKWRWDSYLAIHRSGALEFELGERGSADWSGRGEGEVERGFFLTTIVGRIWVGLSLYSSLLERYDAVKGPWEASLALLRTEGALLGNVAAGWKDLNDWWPGERPTCPDKHLFFRREVWEWPDEAGQKDLAFAFGGMIEDAWGIRDRRWVTDPQQPDAGTFDASRFR